jgi:hypothetical protein
MKYFYIALLSFIYLPSIQAMEEVSIIEPKGLYGNEDVTSTSLVIDSFELSISTINDYFPPKRNVWSLALLMASRG